MAPTGSLTSVQGDLVLTWSAPSQNEMAQVTDESPPSPPGSHLATRKDWGATLKRFPDSFSTSNCFNSLLDDRENLVFNFLPYFCIIDYVV